jgi:hypothetical protein
MSKKINNHSINKEDLLKRVKSGDSEGLDDFEKEAFEGFASLENNELAEKLTADLEKRIDAKYNSEKKEGKVVAFTPKEEPSKFRYYAMAAGLVLVIGLSVVFFNQFTNKEESLAYKPQDGVTTQGDDAVTKSLQNEVAKESGEELGAKSAEAVEAEPKQDPAAQTPPPPPAEKAAGDLISRERKESKPMDDGDAKANEPTPRMVLKSPATKAAPVVTEEQKSEQPDASAVASGKDLVLENAVGGGKAEKDKEVKKGEALAKEDSRSDDHKASEMVSNKKQDVSKNKAKSSSQERANDNLAQAAPDPGNAQTVTKAPESSVATNNPKREEKNLDEMEATKHDEGNAPKTVSPSNTYGAGISGEGAVSLRRSTFFKTPKFANHLEYLKAEININETLKNNLVAYGKAFRIDLVISEKGKVTEAKADVQNNCTNCKIQIENILKAMPNWEPAQNENGKPVKQTFYFSYKY